MSITSPTLSSGVTNSAAASTRICFAPALLASMLMIASTGCGSLRTPGAKPLDLMSPHSRLLSPLGPKKESRYRLADGAELNPSYPSDGSLTMESYQKIREAKAQNAVVLQVVNDEEPIRVLPLPDGEKSAFVSELLTQTGLLKKMGRVDATVYRPSPNTIAGARMAVRFTADGKIDPTTDYCLRPGDRVQVSEVVSSPWKSLASTVLRR